MKSLLLPFLLSYALAPCCLAQFKGDQGLQYVYRVEVRDASDRHVLDLMGFRLAGVRGIVTALHGAVVGKTFDAVGRKNSFEHLHIERVDIANDCALLSSDELDAKPAAGLTPAHAAAVQPWEKLNAFGTPRGAANNLQVMAGDPVIKVLSAIVQEKFEAFRKRGSPDPTIEVLDLQGHLTPGYSGGPVLNASGHVVAVANGGLLRETGIAWAIPIDNLDWQSADSSDSRAAMKALRAEADAVKNLFAPEDLSRIKGPSIAPIQAAEDYWRGVTLLGRKYQHRDRLPSEEDIVTYMPVFTTTPERLQRTVNEIRTQWDDVMKIARFPNLMRVTENGKRKIADGIVRYSYDLEFAPSDGPYQGGLPPDVTIEVDIQDGHVSHITYAGHWASGNQNPNGAGSESNDSRFSQRNDDQDSGTFSSYPQTNFPNGYPPYNNFVPGRPVVQVQPFRVWTPYPRR